MLSNTQLNAVIRSLATDEELAILLETEDIYQAVEKITGATDGKAHIERIRITTKMELRNTQLSLALDGDKDMLKFLGKNYLSQSDNGKDDKPVENNLVQFYLPEKK